jgi:predicted metalloprotease with PDZ domain
VPTGAEIYLNENFVGDTPSTVNAQSGKQTITVKKTGFKNWSRDVTLSGGTITLLAELVPGTSTEVATPVKQGYTVTEVPSGSSPVVHQRASHASLIEVETPPGWIGVETKRAVNGAAVTAIAPDGPAAKAGLIAGDVIQKLNGQVVKEEDFDAVIGSLKPGTHILISYMRSAWARETIITVGKSPN